MRGLLVWLLHVYLGLVWYSSRKVYVRQGLSRRLWNEGSGFLISCFHARILLQLYHWPRRRPVHCLVSPHGDGRLLAAFARLRGYGVVHGSSSRSREGLEAFRAMKRLARRGHALAVSPDGPRGPRQRVSRGIIRLAQHTGLPIVPVANASSRAKVLTGTWDRFRIPLPFSRIYMVWGEPLFVARDASETTLEALRRDLEETMNQLLCDVDEKTRFATPPPG